MTQMRRSCAAALPLFVALTLIGPMSVTDAQTSGPMQGLFPTNELFVEQVYSDVFGRSPDAAGLAYWTDQLNRGLGPVRMYNEFVGSPEFGGTVAPVARLYYSVFDRDPDLDGLRFWVNQRQGGASLRALAEAFLASNEFAALSEADTDEEVVEAVYARVLGRAPDQEGLAFWTGQIASGRLDVPGFVAAVSESAEHRNRRNPDVLVTTAYLGLLQRVPEPEGSEYWEAQVRNGASLVQLIFPIMASDEYRARFAAAPTPTVTEIAAGFTIPWDVAPLPDGRILVTERSGGFWLVNPDRSRTAVTADLGDLWANGETGLMGLAVDPSFPTTGRFYSCQGHTAPREIQVVSWTLIGTTATRVDDPLLGGIPIASGRHGGCQLSIDRAGALVVGTGDSANGTLPQDLTSLGGKTLRIDRFRGGGVPGNPFADSSNANTRRILSYGHRNVQGVTSHPQTGDIWTVEHGPNRDDEVNRIVAGANYGWNPVPGYNESVPMTDLIEFPNATPAAWSTGAPTLALAGAEFIDDPTWGTWTNGLAVTSLKNQSLRVLFFTDDGDYRGQQTVIGGEYGRLRGITEAPDGSLIITTSNGGGQDRILRISP